jgi:hypothetical protein
MKSILFNLRAQLLNKYSPELSEKILDRLRQIFLGLPDRHLKKSLMIFLSPQTERVLSLPTEVEQKVLVDETFEVRDLVYTAQRDVKFLLVSLSKNKVQAYLADLFRIVPIDIPALPENVNDVRNEHSRAGWDYFDSKAFEEKNLRNYLHFIDQKVREIVVSSHYPVILLGDEKALGYYQELVRGHYTVAGVVKGNYEHATMPVIREKIKPAIDNYLLRLDEEALGLLDEAVGMNHFTSGLENTWRAAAEGRGRLLLVEMNYRERARRGNDEYTIVPVATENNPLDILEDAVDDIIQQVMANGGKVRFLPDGALALYNRIVLITRY